MMFTTIPIVTLLAGLAAANPVKRAGTEGLTVKLTPASSSISSIDDLKLVAEVTNTGSEEVKVLKYSTILDSLPTRSFSVSKNGTDIAFTGIKATVKDVNAAFITIGSGETVKVTHSVANIFDFATAGAGTFSFTPRADFKIAGAGSSAVKVSVNVPTVDVEVTGAISRKARRATNVCDDADKASFIDQAVTEGTELASIAADYITSGDGDSLFEDYYGSNSPSTVADIFSAVANENDSGRELSCDDQENVCDGNVIAYTIFFCDIFFDEVANERLCSGTSVASRNIRGGTFLHEMTHALADTDDIIYGCADDRALSPSEAVQNADNYNCFSTQVYADTQC
ncbi:hypothetical protein D9758_014978 [Tetrapyrgos nigripes]|uniref:deuterolysin n=1 Tax=Tetrapyrgos nigripes TaxID=182062 RepID=A0A8H5CG70_9AGAR|nr:hypothetical protein D9758_014978 [Tetrapyrgos nigripes]